MFLAVAVLGACAGTGPDGKLAALEQRLSDEEIVKLLPQGTPAAAVRELLGPPTREYALFPEDIETWEYRLSGFQRPRTLYVQLSAQHLVKQVYVLERRGTTSRDRSHLR